MLLDHTCAIFFESKWLLILISGKWPIYRYRIDIVSKQRPPEYWYRYWIRSRDHQNIDIGIEIETEASRILISVSNSKQRPPEYWYWYWIRNRGHQNIDIDIEFETEVTRILILVSNSKQRPPEYWYWYWYRFQSKMFRSIKFVFVSWVIWKIYNIEIVNLRKWKVV